MKVLEVVGCHSSVVRALVAKASGPGFDSPATTNIFSHFSFAFPQTPLSEKVSFQSKNYFAKLIIYNNFKTYVIYIYYIYTYISFIHCTEQCLGWFAKDNRSSDSTASVLSVL